MAFGSFDRKSSSQPMAEINMVPLIDVVLVLLVIFIVTAPLLTVGVPVDLPQTRAKQLGEDREPLAVSIDKGGKIFLQNSPIDEESLVPKLMAISENGYNQRIFVRGDRDVDYGKVMEVMGLLNSAGFTRIGLVTDSIKKPPPGK